ncbi:MAG: hypothetical protein JW965_00605 [Bacteroidales bacterium]|nr:hypothetical protein [Bacteroidales bacterium]
MNTMIKTTKIKSSVYYKTSTVKDAYSGYLYKQLSDEGSEDFYNYINWLDLVKELNFIILPRTNYYYYQPEDLENIKTVINLKPLNRINKLVPFLESIFSILPDYSYLTGCYENNTMNNAGINQRYITRTNKRDKSKGNENENRYRGSWLFNNMKRIFSSGTYHQLSKERTTSLLKEAGFTILDITALNGRTYFCAQKRPF